MSNNDSAKNRVLLSASKHIARYGLHGFTTNGITTEAKTASVVITDEFDGKDGLICKIFSLGWVELHSGIHDKLVDARELEPGEVVKEVIAGVFDVFEKNRDLVAATVVLGHTVGSPLREKMRESPGFVQQEKLVTRFASTCKIDLSREQVEVVAQIIFGALHRLLFSLTPYMNNQKPPVPAKVKKKRDVIEQVVSGIIEGSLIQGKPLTKL